MSAYYNDSDPDCAIVLNDLIKAGVIAPGDVDTRSIVDVRGDDLRGYSQCHFFAGIGGWSIAARKAGWRDDRPLWTGSCPCQPFSEVGQRKGFDDERHLWPAWFRLISVCRPPIVFGEQVPEAVRLGWLDQVAADLEGCDYAFGSAVLSGCLVEARQERERLWFVACADSEPVERPTESWVERHPWPAEPELPRVAHGIPGHRGVVHMFGNAIIPKLAAEWMAPFVGGRQ